MFQRIKNVSKRISAGWLIRLGSLIALLGTLTVNASAQSVTPNYLHTSGNRILDASGTEVGLSGVNWFGFETDNRAPHGLWARNWKEMLDQIKSLGYNVIRLPFSNDMLDQGRMPSGIDYTSNPDLVNLTSLQVMDQIIAGAGARNIRVILDNHRSTAGGGPESNGLWYTSNYPESRWIDDWKMLAERYKGTDTVIGMDLRNEPFGGCWGCGDPTTDWKLAAEKAGNAILSVNPDLLIIVEGVAVYNGQNTWWGGNLMGAKDFPINLQVPNRLVYSAHEYPASIYPQPWFSDPNYPENLPAIWDKYWGYLAKDAPILIGEFGTRMETESDRLWFQKFQSYIQEKKLHWTFWSLNPDSGDTGGLLLDDWLTINQEKHGILTAIQYPAIGWGSAAIGSASPAIVETTSIPSTNPSLLPPVIDSDSPCQISNTFFVEDFELNEMQNWSTFQSDNSQATGSLISPGQAGSYALKIDYTIGSTGWAGIGRDFNTPQNWSSYQAIQFGFFGTNSGNTIRFEFLDNCSAGSIGDSAERFEYKFIDNFNGWNAFNLPWNLFTRRSDWQPQAAPNDGLNLTSIWGFNFSPISGQGSFQVDDIKLMGS